MMREQKLYNCYNTACDGSQSPLVHHLHGNNLLTLYCYMVHTAKKTSMRSADVISNPSNQPATITCYCPLQSYRIATSLVYYIHPNNLVILTDVLYTHRIRTLLELIPVIHTVPLDILGFLHN